MFIFTLLNPGLHKNTTQTEDPIALIEVKLNSVSNVDVLPYAMLILLPPSNLLLVWTIKQEFVQVCTLMPH